MNKILLNFDDIRDMTLDLNSSLTLKEFNRVFKRVTLINLLSYFAVLLLVVCYMTSSVRVLLGVFVTLANIYLFNYEWKMCATEKDFYYKIKNKLYNRFKLFILIDTFLILFSIVGYNFL